MSNDQNGDLQLITGQGGKICRDASGRLQVAVVAGVASSAERCSHSELGFVITCENIIWPPLIMH